MTLDMKLDILHQENLKIILYKEKMINYLIRISFLLLRVKTQSKIFIKVLSKVLHVKRIAI